MVRPNGSENGAEKKKGGLKAKRSVTFSHKKHIKKIPHLNNLSDQIIDDCWWSPEDYEEFKASFQYLVFMMDSGEEKVENDEETTRGLEFRTQEGAWERFEHKRDAYNAVLDEQDRQWNRNADDPQKISELYEEVCAQCQTAACGRGSGDENDIKEYLTETREEIRKLLENSGSSIQM